MCIYMEAGGGGGAAGVGWGSVVGTELAKFWRTPLCCLQKTMLTTTGLTTIVTVPTLYLQKIEAY